MSKKGISKMSSSNKPDVSTGSNEKAQDGGGTKHDELLEFLSRLEMKEGLLIDPKEEEEADEAEETKRRLAEMTWKNDVCRGIRDSEVHHDLRGNKYDVIENVQKSLQIIISKRDREAESMMKTNPGFFEVPRRATFESYKVTQHERLKDKSKKKLSCAFEHALKSRVEELRQNTGPEKLASTEDKTYGITLGKNPPAEKEGNNALAFRRTSTMQNMILDALNEGEYATWFDEEIKTRQSRHFIFSDKQDKPDKILGLSLRQKNFVKSVLSRVEDSIKSTSTGFYVKQTEEWPELTDHFKFYANDKPIIRNIRQQSHAFAVLDTYLRLARVWDEEAKVKALIARVAQSHVKFKLDFALHKRHYTSLLSYLAANFNLEAHTIAAMGMFMSKVSTMILETGESLRQEADRRKSQETVRHRSSQADNAESSPSTKLTKQETWD